MIAASNPPWLWMMVPSSAVRNSTAITRLTTAPKMLAFWLPVSRAERAIMIAVCLLGLIVELFNSAVEAAIDRISLERHPLSKNAKDMGSAAQLVALTMVALVWGVILL